MAVVASLILVAVILGAGVLACAALEGWYRWQARQGKGPRRRMGWAARLRALPARSRR